MDKSTASLSSSLRDDDDDDRPLFTVNSSGCASSRAFDIELLEELAVEGCVETAAAGDKSLLMDVEVAVEAVGVTAEEETATSSASSSSSDTPSNDLIE